MPATDEILAGLTRIARESAWWAAAWHAALAAGLVAATLGWRPSRRSAAALLSLPLFSVSALAFAGAMPFNGASVGTAALLLLALAPSLGSEPVPRSSTSVMVWAFMLVELGWLYPHFLAESFTLHYLYRAPLGVLPCPTLAAVMGLALLVHGFEARAWSSVLAVFGLFYGLFGAIRLGVAMDLLLVLGGLILLGVVWSNEHARTAGARTARA